MSSDFITALLAQNSQYKDGMGKVIPPEANKSPAKIAELIGAPLVAEKRPVYFKNDDGSFSKAPGREILVRPESVFKTLQETLAEFELVVNYGATVKGSGITVCAQLPQVYDITLTKTSDTIKSFLIVSADTKGAGKPSANKGSVRVINDATFSTSLEETDIPDLMKHMKETIREESQVFNMFLQHEMKGRDVIKYFCEALEVDPSEIGKVAKDGTKKVSTKTENILRGISESYTKAPGWDIGHNTLWGAFQAVLFYGTHLKTVRDTTGTGVEMARATSNLKGDAGKLKVRAFELALNIATKPAQRKKAA